MKTCICFMEVNLVLRCKGIKYDAYIFNINVITLLTVRNYPIPQFNPLIVNFSYNQQGKWFFKCDRTHRKDIKKEENGKGKLS